MSIIQFYLKIICLNNYILPYFSDEDVLSNPRLLNTLTESELKQFEIRFPKLSIKQRQFAVNPGYRSYYNPDYEVIENERDLIGMIV